MLLHKEWFQLRKEFDELHHSVSKNEAIISRNTGKFKEEYYLGYCNDEGDYNSMLFPEHDFDITKLYPHMKNNLTDLSDVSAPATEDVNISSLSDIIKHKLKSLPTPPWPQLDLRTATAISNGIILGPPAPPNLTTLGKQIFKIIKSPLFEFIAIVIFYNRTFALPLQYLLIISLSPSMELANTKFGFNVCFARRIH